uniref:GCR124 n=1 Tax=Schmidtea mediterranea TaxID=79327 RepID=A0A193KUD8_SCHMD|nr:GCR124 [Schmidtea mediterranea]
MDTSIIVLSHSVSLISVSISILMFNRIRHMESLSSLKFCVSWSWNWILMHSIGIVTNSIEDFHLILNGTSVQNYGIFLCTMLELILNVFFIFSTYAQIGMSIVLLQKSHQNPNWIKMYSVSKRWILLVLIIFFITCALSIFTRKIMKNNKCIWINDNDMIWVFAMELIIWFVAPAVTLLAFLFQFYLNVRMEKKLNLYMERGDNEIILKEEIILKFIRKLILILNLYWILVNSVYHIYTVVEIINLQNSEKFNQITNKIFRCPIYIEIGIFCFSWPFLYKYYQKEKFIRDNKPLVNSHEEVTSTSNSSNSLKNSENIILSRMECLERENHKIILPKKVNDNTLSVMSLKSDSFGHVGNSDQNILMEKFINAENQSNPKNNVKEEKYLKIPIRKIKSVKNKTKKCNNCGQKIMIGPKYIKSNLRNDKNPKITKRSNNRQQAKLQKNGCDKAKTKFAKNNTNFQAYNITNVDNPSIPLSEFAVYSERKIKKENEPKKNRKIKRKFRRQSKV